MVSWSGWAWFCVGIAVWVWYGGGILEWVCALGGLVGVVLLQGALWGFGSVRVCGWLPGLGVGWAFWMAAVEVWLLSGVGFGFVLWVSMGGVVCWCGWFWFCVGFGFWGCPWAKRYLINKCQYPPAVSSSIHRELTGTVTGTCDSQQKCRFLK